MNYTDAVALLMSLAESDRGSKPSSHPPTLNVKSLLPELVIWIERSGVVPPKAITFSRTVSVDVHPKRQFVAPARS